MPNTVETKHRNLPPPSDLAHHWALDPDVVFLNHGSFGACPRAMLKAQDAVRTRMESEPIRFFVEELEALLDAARAALGEFLGADPEGLVRVTNATEGVNTVVRSLRFEPGDELLSGDHEYNACNNALDFAAERWGARVVRAHVPWPLEDPEQVVRAIVGAVTERTRLALVSHVTSPTGVVFPVERIVRELHERGVDTIVDGAHAPGMVRLDLDALGAAYYTGNCHKWMCAPKGTAFLWVRPDRRDVIRPLVISHGANSKRTDRPRFRLEFDYCGTADVSGFVILPELIRFMAGLVGGGWPEIMRRNRELAIRSRDVLCREMGSRAPAPDSMLGSLAAVWIADRRPERASIATRYHDELQDRLIANWGIQAPIVPFPAETPRRMVRASAQLYNTVGQVEYLARALNVEVEGE